MENRTIDDETSSVRTDMITKVKFRKEVSIIHQTQDLGM